MSTTRKNSDGAAADEWVTLAVAARLLGLHRQKVLQLALGGSLKSDVRGRWTFISQRSIDEYLAAQPIAVAQ
jgi:hypothetical protein